MTDSEKLRPVLRHYKEGTTSEAVAILCIFELYEQVAANKVLEALEDLREHSVGAIVADGREEGPYPMVRTRDITAAITKFKENHD